MADVYCWYVMVPGGEPPQPRVTWDRLEAVLRAADALEGSPPNAVAIVTRTPLGRFVSDVDVHITDVLGDVPTDCGPDSLR